MTAKHSRPQLIHKVSQLRAELATVRRQGKTIGVVPTMGALHEGHLSLVRASKEHHDVTVVWIYVNPSQFGSGEDLDQYPRTLSADLDRLAECGAEIAFAPGSEEVYPDGYATWVEVGSVADRLEGEARPEHFRGVATIVLKLFNMIGGDVAYFGQKDYQQVQVIRRMVTDLDVPIDICMCPTVREPDGLAMSSRNVYLSPDARERATVLWKSLCLADDLVKQGERDASAIVQKMREVIMTAANAQIEYIDLSDPDTLEPVTHVDRPTLASLAVKIENTRLIDNRLLVPSSDRSE